MSVGLPVTKGEIDSRAGDIARNFQKSFENVATMHAYLQQTADADLVALGYTSQEVAVMKSAYADLALLGRVWAGLEPLPEAKDFRAFVRQLWGVGSF